MASTKVSPNSNIKNEIDEPEMIKINSTMKSIGDNNEDDIKNTSSNDSFADKVKRPPSWAELAVTPPPPSVMKIKIIIIIMIIIIMMMMIMIIYLKKINGRG